MAPAPTKLSLTQFVPRGQHFHIARGVYQPGGRGRPHTHDFAEVAWIESGMGTHLINGDVQPLAAGDVLFIRPTDVHDFRGRHGGLTLMNVAFAREVVRELRNRYFARQRGEWLWPTTPLPAMRKLDAAAMRRVTEAAELLAHAPQSRLSLDRFLLSLLGESAEPAHDVPDASLPAWLSEAVRSLAGDSDHLIAGVPRLAELADRSREHVNRVIRAHTGGTATELINRVRLDRAASDLRLTSKSIVEVAVDCGMPNLGYFYRRFQERFGTTPRKYRLRQQAVLRG